MDVLEIYLDDGDDVFEDGVDTLVVSLADLNLVADAATCAAELAGTVLAQVLKSRQDAATARAPELSRDVWDKAQRQFGSAIRYLEFSKSDQVLTQANRIGQLSGFQRPYRLLQVGAGV